ncbi:MAG: hypothetical protein MJ146_00290 [Clostridia bacterium]|nr:hypothetical protein [Clostridia bacterium]
MKKAHKISSFILIIILPLLVSLLALNISLRAPEVYSYHLNESQAIDYTTLDLTANDLADQMSDFLGDFFGDEVDITENAGYANDPVFSDTEQEILFELRDYLSISLLIGIILLLMFIGLFFFLYAKEEDELIYTSVKIGVLAGLAFTILTGIALALKPVRNAFYASQIGIKLAKDSVLSILFTKGNFWINVDVVYAALSVILIFLIYYITKRICDPDKMFDRRGKW